MNIILFLIIGYFILFFITPKGTILQEMLNIPIFWVRNFTISKKNLITRKIKFGKHRQQYFIFCQPKKNIPLKKHAILYFHGGAWMAGSPEILKAAGQLFADHGYVSVFSNYRKAPFFSYPDMREDISASLKKLNKYLKEENLNIDKFIIGGMSAGANLAALLTYDDAELKKINISPKQIRGAFLSGSPVDIEQMKWSIPLYFYAGNRLGKNFKKANPINYLSEPESRPILMIHGNKDGLVPFRNTTTFLQKINSINPNLAKMHLVQNGTHMDTASWSYEDNEIRRAILDWLEEREAEIN
ncbi:MAG: alpha/beta hydrolase [Saprospiraceae bacterium]